MADSSYLRYLKSCDRAKAQQWTDSDVYVEPVPPFRSSVAALEYATDSMARLSERLRANGAIDSCELQAVLVQVAAVLTECTRLHAQTAHQENG